MLPLRPAYRSGLSGFRSFRRLYPEAANPVELAVVAEPEFQYGAEAFEAHQQEAEKAMTTDKAAKSVPVQSEKSR